MQLYKPVNNIQFNFSKLKGRITETGYTYKALAETLGMTEATFSYKINNKTPFKPVDIINLCGLLDIPADQIHIYFFTPDYGI